MDSLANPLMIFTICVPKEGKNTIHTDYQIVRLYVPKTKIVENGEIVWKYSTKNWGMAFFLIDYLFKFIRMSDDKCIKRKRQQQASSAYNCLSSYIYGKPYFS